MQPPEEYEGSTRAILHIVPQDGTEHAMVECFCHPRIVEANASRALFGWEDVGVPETESGQLIFLHNKAADSHVTRFLWECNDDEGADE